MFKINSKMRLAEDIYQFEIEAPLIAKKALAGQFVMIRINEAGERIPLTIADSDPDKGFITIISLSVGKSTKLLALMQEGDFILDVLGPLGKPSEIELFGKVICIGGGVGIAPLMPITRALKNAGNYIVTIIGAKTKSQLILGDKMKDLSDEFYACSDDGTLGFKGFVTDFLNNYLQDKIKKTGTTQIDRAIAIGPTLMMKFVCAVTKKYDIPTIVSLNSVMVDGTGMCGTCRVEVGQNTMFACVDGPDFDGSEVDFDLLLARQGYYMNEEKKALDSWEKNINCKCRQKE